MTTRWQSLAALLLLCGCSDRQDVDCPQPTAETPALDQNALSSLMDLQLPPVVDVGEMLLEYDRNELSAERKYGGFPVIVRGVVGQVYDDGDAAEVQLNNGINTFAVRMPDKDAAAGLRQGYVTLFYCGQISKRDSGGLSGIGCKVIGTST